MGEGSATRISQFCFFAKNYVCEDAEMKNICSFAD